MGGIWLLIAIVLAPAVALVVLVARRSGMLAALVAALLAGLGAVGAVAAFASPATEHLSLDALTFLAMGLTAAGPAVVLVLALLLAPARRPKG